MEIFEKTQTNGIFWRIFSEISEKLPSYSRKLGVWGISKAGCFNSSVVASSPRLIIRSEVGECDEYFNCLGSLISPGSRFLVAYLKKSRRKFRNLGWIVSNHITCRRRDAYPPTKERVYYTENNSVFLYVCRIGFTKVKDKCFWSQVSPKHCSCIVEETDGHCQG